MALVSGGGLPRTNINSINQISSAPPPARLRLGRVAVSRSRPRLDRGRQAYLSVLSVRG